MYSWLVLPGRHRGAHWKVRGGLLLPQPLSQSIWHWPRHDWVLWTQTGGVLSVCEDNCENICKPVLSSQLVGRAKTYTFVGTNLKHAFQKIAYNWIIIPRLPTPKTLHGNHHNSLRLHLMGSS